MVNKFSSVIGFKSEADIRLSVGYPELITLISASFIGDNGMRA